MGTALTGTAGSNNQLQHALTLLQQGRRAQADALCRQVLAAEPREFHALHLLGIAALQSGEFAAAEPWLRAAIAVDCGVPAAHLNLAVVLLAQRRPAEALEHSEAALRLQGNLAQGWAYRAKALAALRRDEESLASYERALGIDPDHLESLNNRGIALLHLHRPREALAMFERAIELAPDFADAFNNRGSALRRLRRSREAIDSYRQALRLQPDSPDVLSNMANAALGLESLDEALELCDRALALKPDLADALNIRATVLRDLGRQEDAADAYAQLLKVAPDFDYAAGNLLFARANTCDWPDRAGEASRVVAAIRAGRRGCLPFSLLPLSDSAALQLWCARTFVADRCPPAAPRKLRPLGHGRIRVAYVSGDFREHAVSYLLAGLFERHDQSRFETFAVSLRPEQPSALGQRVKRAFSRFIDASELSSLEIAEMLVGLEVDIAVDLAGYTSGMRPEIFAHRAAPLQVSYLGFPGTLGVAYMDYLIADEFVVPRHLQSQYSERIVYLPGCFQSYDDRRQAPPPAPSRAEVGLPDRAVVLCSFNNSYKINPPLFDIWMRLLAQLPHCVLWLLGERDSVRRNLRREARDRGVDPERLVFARRCPYGDHLARLPLADLFLDSLPFNAGATASDALSMGLPVLTAAGEAFAARMAGSLLTHLGMPELIAGSLGEYEAMALDLARRPEQLHSLKHRLRDARSTMPMFDTDRFRRHLESAYTEMYGRARRGGEPASFTVARAAN
jgi:predicted O-linked N-acetylglucosamine transferase (SPINDLY family)